MNDRPKIKIAKSRKARYLELLSITIAFGSLFYLIKDYASLPLQVPVHFNFAGTPDGMGHKVILLCVPILNVLIAVGFSFLTKYPHKFNYPFIITAKNAEAAYKEVLKMLRLLGVLVSLLLAYITLASISIAVGKNNALNPYIIGILLVAIILNLLIGFINLRKKATY